MAACILWVERTTKSYNTSHTPCNIIIIISTPCSMIIPKLTDGIYSLKCTLSALQYIIESKEHNPKFTETCPLLI